MFRNVDINAFDSLKKSVLKLIKGELSAEEIRNLSASFELDSKDVRYFANYISQFLTAEELHHIVERILKAELNNTIDIENSGKERDRLEIAVLGKWFLVEEAKKLDFANDVIEKLEKENKDQTISSVQATTRIDERINYQIPPQIIKHFVKLRNHFESTTSDENKNTAIGGEFYTHVLGPVLTDRIVEATKDDKKRYDAIFKTLADITSSILPETLQRFGEQLNPSPVSSNVDEAKQIPNLFTQKKFEAITKVLHELEGLYQGKIIQDFINENLPALGRTTSEVELNKQFEVMRKEFGRKYSYISIKGDQFYRNKLAYIAQKIRSHDFRLGRGGGLYYKGKNYASGALEVLRLIEEALQSQTAITKVLYDEKIKKVIEWHLKDKQEIRQGIFGFFRRDKSTVDLYKHILDVLETEPNTECMIMLGEKPILEEPPVQESVKKTLQNTTEDMSPRLGKQELEAPNPSHKSR